MSRLNRIILVLACCAAFAACKTQQTPSADPVACKSTCEGTYAECQPGCKVEDEACPERCVNQMQSCKERCG